MNGLDAILNLLAAGDRREIVHGIRQQAAGETTIDDLAELLAADGLVTENDSERRSITLYPVNLPKLADYGSVQLDRERRTVRYQPTVHVERMMDPLPQSGGPTTRSGSSDEPTVRLPLVTSRPKSRCSGRW